MEDRVDIEKEAKKADDATKSLVIEMLEKMEEMKAVRKKIMSEKHFEINKLRAQFDSKVLRLANDVIKYEESCKALVGPKRYRRIKSAWTNARKPVKEKPEAPLEKTDPLLKEMKDITQTPD